MVIGGSVVGYRPVPAYAGPGDIVAGAIVWVGLRAYSLDTVGNNAIRLRRSSDNTEQDFATITGGGLDLAAISAFKGAANLFIVKLYDQSGNGRDVIQATAANQPSFTLAGLGALPIAGFDAGSSQSMATTATITQAQPLTFSFVAKQTAGGTRSPISSGSTNCLVQMPFGQSGALVSLYCGGHLDAGSTDTNWHAVQCVGDSTSSVVNIDGSETTGAAGSSAFSGHTFQIGTDAFGELFTGNATEWGLWPAGFSSGERTAMQTNQSTYWGL